MKLFATFVMVVVLGVSALGAPSGNESNKQSDEKRICVPGKSYYDGCNWCRCDPNHNIYCTLVGCNQHNPNEPYYSPIQKPPADFWQSANPKPARKCVPGATYYNGCNNCWCSRDKREACTRMACYVQDSNGQQIRAPQLEAPEGFWEK